MSVKALLMAAALTAGGVCAAAAQTAPEPPAAPMGPPAGGGMKACAADKQTFCGSVQPGGGRIAQCFKANFESLSSACQDALKARAARRSHSGPQPGG
jgi:hypothetical protein